MFMDNMSITIIYRHQMASYLMISVPLPPSSGILSEFVANPIPNMIALSTPMNSDINDSHCLCSSDEPKIQQYHW